MAIDVAGIPEPVFSPIFSPPAVDIFKIDNIFDGVERYSFASFIDSGEWVFVFHVRSPRQSSLKDTRFPIIHYRPLREKPFYDLTSSSL